MLYWLCSIHFEDSIEKAWDFHLNNLEVDLENNVIEHIQLRPLHTLPHLFDIACEIIPPYLI